VLIGTNRDEDPARASEPPQVLRRTPLVLGGRDAVAGGTWLALRAGVRPGTESLPHAPGVAMLLNRHDPEPGKAGRRSRGLLTLDVAAASDPRATAEAEAATGRYAPCTLVWLAGEEAWLLAIRAGQAPTFEPIAQGWHAITHFELDDPTDRRTTWLLQQLAGWRPESRAEVEELFGALLGSHGGRGAPPVCMHSGRARTVSAAMVWLAPAEIAYQHAQGPPCVTPFKDWTHLAE